MKAAIAFCNDVDFADWSSFEEVHRVLENELGIFSQDSFWLFDPAGSDMALFTDSVKHKGPRHDLLLEEMKKDRLSILHSVGNFSFTNTGMRATRELVADGLAFLKEHSLLPLIWTNHGDEGDIQNIGGACPTYQEGDLPGSSCYILDLLLQYGIKYFCTDINLINTFCYSPGGRETPALMEKVRTRSGHLITTFNRYRGALPKAPDAQSLAIQLSEENLAALIEQEAYTVIYQHWCVHRDDSGKAFTAKNPVFPESTMKSLRRLVKHRDDGDLRILKLTDLLQEYSARPGQKV